MKRTGFVLGSLALVIFSIGCASAGKAAVTAQKDPIALVSVVSNWDINWQGEDPINPNVIGPLTKRALRGGPDLAVVSNAEELINSAEKIFRDTMGELKTINLADRDTVLDSQAYQSAKLNKYQMYKVNEAMVMVKPENFRFVDYRDKDFYAALAAETGIQRSMFVEFKFTKTMASGFGKNGECRAQIDMTVNILDAQGKGIFKKTYNLASRDTTKVSSGVYSKSELMSLFDSVISDGCYEFLDDLAN